MELEEQRQPKPEAFDTVKQQQQQQQEQQQRRSANYKPNIWKYDFLQSLSTKHDEEQFTKQAEKLKQDLKCIFAGAEDMLSKLGLIDNIIKLGLASHFEEEIKETLDTISSSSIKNKVGIDGLNNDNLYLVALYFRLLRQHGYQVSQEMFGNFVDAKGKFIPSKCMDIKAVLELFEASHLAFEGENILDEAKAFSIGILKSTGTASSTESNLRKRVVHTLSLPSHWRAHWFDVKWQINMYENEDDPMDKVLIEFSKRHFNMVQSTLQKDLREISGWWKNLGLIENVKFTRDRLVESFMCTVGLVFEAQHSSFRKWLTKVVIMILIIDDVYDVYGSLEELQLFTSAVRRWDPREIQQLPECMKLCFHALYEITNETANEMQREKGWNQVQPHLQKVWADFCKALYNEAKWCNEGHKPSLQEYLSNGWISSSGTVLSVHSFFSAMNDTADQDMLMFLEKNQDLVYNISLIIRLCNDLGTSVAEQERGDAASSIICYMREANAGEDIARKHINGMINKTWKKINGQCFNQTANKHLQNFVDINTNMARVVHNLYQFGDGFDAQDREENKKQILSLLVEPFDILG